ncbi:MAG: DUF559 domain-containing protein [Pseudomonadota bacterium]
MLTPAATKARAKRLRREMSAPERQLWWSLRANQLDGLHFRRQHPLGPYVLDFYCHRARLAVEVDGGTHRMPGRRESDIARDLWLQERSIHTLRLPTHVVENNINSALEMIRRAVGRPRH